VFRINVPSFPIFFSGTGDMFAALTVARLRQAAMEAGVSNTASWRSPDDVPATELPLAKATEKVLASMQAILGKTYDTYLKEAKGIEDNEKRRASVDQVENSAVDRMHLLKTKAAEVRVVRNVRDLLDPPEVERYKAMAVDEEINGVGSERRKPNEFGVINLGIGGEGAMHVLNDRRWGP